MTAVFLHWEHFFFKSMAIQLSEGERMARKLLAKCQKQPWQQPCNLIVSHEETFRQFVSPSHEQTAGLRWPCLFSWKNKVSKAQYSFGQNTFKYFFFFKSVHIPRLYLNMIKKYRFLKHHQWDKFRLTQLALLKSNTTKFSDYFSLWSWTLFEIKGQCTGLWCH